jgi:multidrug efflux pump subunit AcrA (membrane-fusion protein)
MKKYFIISGIIIIISVVLIFLIFGSDSDKSSVKIITKDVVKRGELKSVLMEQGVIKPQVGAQIEIGTRATGEIIDMNVKVGDVVKKGQLIAKLDSRDIEKEISQAREEINILTKELQLENETYPYQRQIYLERISDFESRMQTATGKYERETYLYRRGFSAKEELDIIKSDYDSAKAALNQAKLELDRYDREHNLNVEKIKLEIKKQNSFLEELMVRLSFTDIYSPIDGIVTQVAAEAGETLVSGLQVGNLITVLNPNLLELWIYVDETDISKVSIGQQVEYNVDTYPDRTFTGKVDRINVSPDIFENIVYYRAIVNIDNKTAEFLKPEMTTRCKIIIASKTGKLVIPNEALKWKDNRYIVYKIIDESKGLTEEIPVEIGQQGDTTTEVLEGLMEGDKIAVEVKLSERST